VSKTYRGGDTGHVAFVALGPIWDVCTSCARGGTHVRAKGNEPK
jgi:hypothetical protein